ncbi:MAG: YdcF family protein, partial [Elusimicrobiota bacterium]
MFIIKKILTPFLIPPGIFVVLALCLAARQFRKNRKQAAAWAVFALLMWAAASGPPGNMALAGLEYSYLPPAEVKADAIVILSAGIEEGGPG